MRRLEADNVHRAMASAGRLTATTDWSTELQEVEAIIHCAARVHVMRDEVADPLAQYRAVNVDGALQLARQAAAAGVKRFIFISSIKVNGEVTEPGKPFTADDTPNPQDAYGISKHEAELGLRAIAKQTGMELVILRPALVYASDAKGNLATMAKLMKRGLPMPFASINNRRSIVTREGLVELILICLTHPAAANEIFVVSDVIYSTPELVRKLAGDLGIMPRLIPYPPLFLKLATKLIGRPGIGQRLCDSLEVDRSKAKRLLGWPPS